MIELKENFNLIKYNTFGVSVEARLACFIQSESDLKELLNRKEFKENKHIFLGCGSNVLFVADFPGIVVLNKLRGIETIKEDETSVYVRVAGGEGWHAFVEQMAERGLWGLENLALIPGTVGGAPVQNIGAYGNEVEDTIFEVEAYDLNTGEKRFFTNSECGFGYRDSVFKSKLKGKYFISAVIFKLSKIPKINVDYKILADYLIENNIAIRTPKDIVLAVVSIRKSKLPDPAVLGNAGSFFKNVYVDEDKFNDLLKKYPNIPSFKENGQIKIPTGWLVEQLGWKGKRIGRVGVYDKQSLVLVNYGGATGSEIYDLAQKIIADVQEKFGIIIVPEVNII